MSSKQSRDKVAHAMRDAAKPILDAQKQQNVVCHSTDRASNDCSINDTFFHRLQPQTSMHPLNTSHTVLDYFNIPISFPPMSPSKTETSGFHQSGSINYTNCDNSSSNLPIGSNERITRLSPDHRNFEVAMDVKKKNVDFVYSVNSRNHIFNGDDDVTKLIQLIQTDKYPLACETDMIKTSILTPTEDLACPDFSTFWRINNATANYAPDLENKPSSLKTSNSSASPVDETAIEDSFVKAIDDALGPLDKDDFDL